MCVTAEMGLQESEKHHAGEAGAMRTTVCLHPVCTSSVATSYKTHDETRHRGNEISPVILQVEGEDNPSDVMCSRKNGGGCVGKGSGEG